MANDSWGLESLVLLWIMFLAVNPTRSVIPAEELQALKAVAEALGTNVWSNRPTDPCTGRWPGVKCCTRSQLSSDCCNSNFTNPTLSSSFCGTFNDSMNSTVVGVNLDASYPTSGPMITGFISDSVCNLTSLVTLDLSNNLLSGGLPSCIGSRLTRLKKLGLSGGTMSGGIPSEFGMLSDLEELYLANHNLTGSIPSSIGGMINLKKLSLRNNKLDGELPQELGKLENLTDLFIQVNRFSGTLPLALAPVANLTSLKNLVCFNNRFSGELGLSVLQNLVNLETIDFRLNKLTGSVPALDGRFSNLKNLDLGFNRLSGTIPDTLSKVPTLQHVFLGHNDLTGNVPDLSSFSSLQILDISHNSLTGHLPGTSNTVQTDFSFNSFNTFSNSETYFNCLTPNRSDSCARTRAGKEALFAVRGGSVDEVKNTDGTTFRRDAVSNRTGMYYLDLAGADNWALEISGLASGTLDAQSDITLPPGYRDSPEIYKTMRWSSSYMAYHGSNLVDGEYTVTLYFCETAFDNQAFRVFDVRLQNETIAERLDVAKEVGFMTAYKLTRNKTVRDGRMSIEFIYTGNNRYIDQNKYRVSSTGVMVSAISVRSFSYVSPSSSRSDRWKPAVIASAVLFVVVILVLCIVRRKVRKTNMQRTVKSWPRIHAGIRAFTYSELSKATDGFNPRNKLGQGGFGSVYMGQLDDDVLIAVKQLLHQNEQGKDAFCKEIEILSNVQHRNLVAIRGYCIDLADHPMLVCDYMRKGSLEGFLHGDSGYLTWEQRRSIALDTALGLAYLHDESKYRIIHCDVKPSNILLDDELRPRIADFGMARLYDEGRSHVTATRLGGTIGYLAPEYAMHYQLSDKADVYSFGVVLLEMISGRRALDSRKPAEQVVLVEYAQKLALEGTLARMLLNKRLEEEIEESETVMSEVVKMGRVAVLCTLENPVLRPGMRSVWLMLKGTMEIPDVQPLSAESRLGTVRALMSAYEQFSSPANSHERLMSLSPR